MLSHSQNFSLAFVIYFSSEIYGVDNMIDKVFGLVTKNENEYEFWSTLAMKICERNDWTSYSEKTSSLSLPHVMIMFN